MALNAPTLLDSGTDDTDGDTYSTGSFTPGTNRTVFFAWTIRQSPTEAIAPAITNHGTWEFVGYIEAGGGSKGEVWKLDTGGSTSASAIDIDLNTASGSPTQIHWAVFEFDVFVEVVQTETEDNASQSGDAYTLTLDTTPGTENTVVGIMQLGNDAMSVAPGTGFTELVEISFNGADGDRTLQVQYDSTAADNQVDWTWSTYGGSIQDFFAMEVRRKVDLTGSLPAQSGALSFAGSLALAGSLPAMAGVLSIPTAQIAVTGNLPAQSGVLAYTAVIALGGSLPAMNGALGLAAQSALTGDLPAMAGALEWVQTISLTGSLPAMSGDLDLVAAIALAGSLPAQNGVLSLAAASGLTGSLPAQNGVLSYVATLGGLQGDLPAQNGAIDILQVLAIALTGSLPAMNGGLGLSAQVALGGNLPAMSGEVTALVSKTLEGSLPAMTGALSLRILGIIAAARLLGLDADVIYRSGFDEAVIRRLGEDVEAFRRKGLF